METIAHPPPMQIAESEPQSR